MKGIEDLVSGFRRFQRRYFGEQRELYERPARASQARRIMVIGCRDSRVDPALILRSGRHVRGAQRGQHVSRILGPIGHGDGPRQSPTGMATDAAR